MVLKAPQFNPTRDGYDSVLRFENFHAGSLKALLYRHSIVDTGYRDALVLEDGTMLYFDRKPTRSSLAGSTWQIQQGDQFLGQVRCLSMLDNLKKEESTQFGGLRTIRVEVKHDPKDEPHHLLTLTGPGWVDDDGFDIYKIRLATRERNRRNHTRQPSTPTPA